MTKGYPYTKKQRITVLTPEQIIAAQRIGKELVTTVQLLVDDRIGEDKNLRVLQQHHFEEEMLLVNEIILKEFKTEVKKMQTL